jgi:hypothetical protein
MSDDILYIGGIFQIIAYGGSDTYYGHSHGHHFDRPYSGNFDLNFETKLFSQFQEHDRYNQHCCPICTDDLAPDDTVSVRKCGHVYHKECHEDALEKCPEGMKICPICRK